MIFTYYFCRVHDTVSQDLGNTLVQWYFPSENLDIIIAIIDRKTLFLRTWNSFIVIPSFHYVVIISRYYWECSGRSYSAHRWSFPLKRSLENMRNHGGITIDHITETFFTFLSEFSQRKTSFCMNWRYQLSVWTNDVTREFQNNLCLFLPKMDLLIAILTTQSMKVIESAM